MANVKKNLFVYTSGIFGKYLLRGLVYLGENLVAFIGLMAIVAVSAAIAYTFGLTTAGVVAAATALTASTPALAQLAMLAIPVAASEIIKKIYKDNVEWIVTAYKGLVANLFKPAPASFVITEAELDIKRAKHPEPEKAEKYATPKSYKEAKKEEYKLKNLDRKYPDLDIAGRAGKRAFKAAAVHISDGLYWLANGPSSMGSARIGTETAPKPQPPSKKMKQD